MAATTKTITNFKFLLVMCVKNKYPSLMEEYVDRLATSFRGSKASDFGEYVGEQLLTKGNKFELFLRDKGVWVDIESRAKGMMTSKLVDDAIIAENPSHKGDRWKHRAKANAMRLNKATEMIVKSSTRILSRLMQNKGTRFSEGVKTAFIHSLGVKEMSSGSWVAINKGLERRLKNPVGGVVNKVVKFGGAYELAIFMSKPVESVAKKYGLPVADKVKETLKAFGGNVFAAATCALFLAASPVDMTESDTMKVVELTSSHMHLESTASYADFDSIDSLSRYERSEVELSIIQKEMSYAQQEDLLFSGVEPSFEEIDNFFVEPVESFSDKLGNAVDSGKIASSVTVKDGENLWLIASDLTNKLVDGFGIVISHDGDPSEMTKLISTIHNQIIEVNDLDDNDMIVSGQKIGVPDSVVSQLSMDLDQRLTSVADILRDKSQPKAALTITR